MFETIDRGSITNASGFYAAGVSCGLKKSGKKDLALVVSDGECTAAGAFTRNAVVAAPVSVDRETLGVNSTNIRAVVANAGNANACTGKEGLAAAQEMPRLTAETLGCKPEQILVLSTGVIGVQLDMEKIANGIKSANSHLTEGGGADAARAIMTTDTYPKETAVQVPLSGGTIRIGGIAKGSGMIHPNMGTMLSVITTDAQVSSELLQDALSAAVEQTFNRISVDGDTSTNDTVLLLANGASDVQISDAETFTQFREALTYICQALAKMIVRDGEGASRLVEILVTGAQDDADALYVAQTVATSPLVKTAIAGGDPNWGRILAAAGRSGAVLDQSLLALAIRNPNEEWLWLVKDGTPQDYLEADAGKVFSDEEIMMHLDLGLGKGQTTMWTCDLTHDYVSINADYRT